MLVDFSLMFSGCSSGLINCVFSVLNSGISIGFKSDVSLLSRVFRLILSGVFNSVLLVCRLVELSRLFMMLFSLIVGELVVD